MLFVKIYSNFKSFRSWNESRTIMFREALFYGSEPSSRIQFKCLTGSQCLRDASKAVTMTNSLGEEFIQLRVVVRDEAKSGQEVQAGTDGCRSHGGVLLPDLPLIVCSSCFLYNPGPLA